jgi:hypothetical protein
MTIFESLRVKHEDGFAGGANKLLLPKPGEGARKCLARNVQLGCHDAFRMFEFDFARLLLIRNRAMP